MTDQQKQEQKNTQPPQEKTISGYLILLIVLIAVIYANVKNDDSFPTNVCIPMGLVFSGMLIFLSAYYEKFPTISWKLTYKIKCPNEKKKWHLGIGASLFISGLLDIIALPLNTDWYLILLRYVLLIMTTFIALFMADAINKS